MNGFYGGFIPQAVGFGQPPPLPYTPTRFPPYEKGFNLELWAYMCAKQPPKSTANQVPKPKTKVYGDWEWKLLVQTLAKCDVTDYYMEDKGVSMANHVWFNDPYYLNKMIATQHAYPPTHPVTLMDVEIKSQFHESTANVPELEIRYVKDTTTPDVIYDCLTHHFVSGGVIHSLRIGERQSREKTMTVFVRFFSIETYLEAFLPHIRLNKHFIDPTCVRIEGIPAGGRKLFDKLCAFAQKKWGMIHDTKFKDKPDGCDCYIRLRLPTIADDMRQYNWRDPDAPPEFFDIITSTPVYALWGSGGKPPGAFVDKDLSRYIPLQDQRMISQRLQQRLAMQHLDNPTYQQAFGIEAHGMAGNQVPLPMMGNATPFPNMGNATPFPSMTGNATPFNSMGGNATSWNPISSYAATPFHSFSLDNAGSTSNDPRFPAPQMIEDMPPQSDIMVDQGFSRRANANNRPGSTKSRGSYASRGKSSTRAPVSSGSRRGSRSTNDGNDATDLSAVDQEVDALETSSQKSSYSRSSSKGSSKKRPRSLSRTSRDHRKMSTSDKSIRMQEIFPVESEDADIDILRKAQESAIVWNKPENMEKLHAYEAIFDHYVEKIVAARKAKYAALNEMPEEDDPTEEVTTTEAIPSVIPEQT